MKKNSILILILLSGFIAQAQSEKFKIGFRVSPNLSWVKSDNNKIEAGGTVMRFGFGMAIDKMFTDNYAFGTGIDIGRMGGELTYLATGQVDGQERVWEVNRTYSTQYAEIPLTLKLRTNEIGYITYWGQFGLGLGFNIRSKADENIVYSKDKYAETEGEASTWHETKHAAISRDNLDIKDDTKLFRTSLIMALGIEYNLSGSTSIIAGVTFNNGFSNFLNGKGVQTNDRGNIIGNDGKEISGTNSAPGTYDLKAINNYIALNVGVLF